MVIKLRIFVVSRSGEYVFLRTIAQQLFFPLFCGNLTAKFDKKHARFQETNRI